VRARAKATFPGLDFKFNLKSAFGGRRGGTSARVRSALGRKRPPLPRRLWRSALGSGANDLAAEFVRSKIREIVRNPEVAELLSSKNVLGCKRLSGDTGYWAKYNRSNVTLIEVSREPIEAITPAGFHVRDREYAVDAIALATGFDAMTGALLKIDVGGSDGRALEEKRCEGPKTYLGLGIAGFRNLFTITGPVSPSNMLQSIEQQVEWMADCIGYLRHHGFKGAGRGRRGLAGVCPRIGRRLTALDL